MKQLLLALLVFGVLFAGVELFDSCITIEDTGTYVLVEDIEYSGDSRCINVLASSVTIDCGGHSITGAYPATGILVKEGVRKVDIKDCNIGFFEHGIETEKNVGEITLENVNIDSTKEGLYLVNGHDLDTTDCSFTNNNKGMYLKNWIGGTTTNAYFSNREYGAFFSSVTEYTIDSSEFTNSEFGVYTEGICDDTQILNSEFHILVTPLDLYGTSAQINGNIFHDNAGYAVLVREALNSFRNNIIYDQLLYFAVQSKGFTLLNLTIGEYGEVGSANFREFVGKKPFTTTKYYYFNSTNVILNPEFISVTSDEQLLTLKDVKVWLEDPEGIEGDVVLFNSPAKATSREEVLLDGEPLIQTLPEEVSPGIYYSMIPSFSGSYALGERPEDLLPERYVVIMMIDAPTVVEANSSFIINVKDQNAKLLPGASISYYIDAEDATYVGKTDLDGEIELFIPTQGPFIIEATYNDVASQRPISVEAPEIIVVEEAAPEEPAEPDFSTEIPEEPEAAYEPAPTYTYPEAQEPEPAAAEPQTEALNFPLEIMVLGLVLVLGALALGIYLVLKKPPKKTSPEDAKYQVQEHIKKYKKE